MEEDTLFEELKKNVESSRRKIRKCMVLTGEQHEKISWNSIWNELQKTDWHASTELIQRLKVWYSLGETISTPNLSEPKANVGEDCGDKQEDRDLSHTLPAFMIESLVRPGDRWDADAVTKITLNKPSSDEEGSKFGGYQQHAAVQNVSPFLDSGVDSTNEYLTNKQSRDLIYNFPVTHSPERLGGYVSPQHTPLDSSNYQAHYSFSQRHYNHRHDTQQKQRTVKKEHWCPPANFRKEEKKRSAQKPTRKSQYNTDSFSVDSPPFIPRAYKMLTQRNWQFEAKGRGFNKQSNYRVKPDVPRRSTSNHFHLQPLTGENPNAEGVPWKPPTQQYHLHRMSAEKPRVKSGRPKRSSPQKYNLRRLDIDNPKCDKLSFKPRNESKRRLRSRPAIQKQRKQHYNAQREGRRSKGPVFPPRKYRHVKGDWVVHAIVSLSVQPNDLRLALEKRGYELKYITKRKCKLKDKWVCSLIANADRTHVLTSENIWVNSWEVEFVCNEEEIARFLLK